ncbi:hypothetical protein, partial [Extibacter muris]|uniref:hypothetical protein n=1 Tax=Extibacter muris TaxID=1796622 RepID=UPI001A9AC8A6
TNADLSLTNKSFSTLSSKVDENCSFEQIGSWRVYKYASGKAEAYYCQNFGTVALTGNRAAGVYTHNDFVTKTFTIPTGIFKTAFYADVNVLTSGYTSCQVSGLTSTTCSIRIWSSYATTVSNLNVFLKVVGLWR